MRLFSLSLISLPEAVPASDDAVNDSNEEEDEKTFDETDNEHDIADDHERSIAPERLSRSSKKSSQTISCHITGF